MKPTLCLVTPALASANNGNWQTAARWARMLGADYRVRLLSRWDGRSDDLMIALHARRSADSVAAWSRQLVHRPLVLVLTGTDLYRDLAIDAEARRSIELADRLVVLNEAAIRDVPVECRDKTVVSFQSCSAWRPLAKTARRLRALMVGHLREEKDPATYFAAASRLGARRDIVLDHVGGALDETLAAQARVLMHTQQRYRWLGNLSHRDTRARIQRAHVLVHCSRMEGGAHVVMEAVRSGTPVLASRIAGNVGMLGADYGGYFETGDAAGLAALLERARDDPAMLPALRAQCARRAPLFEPAQEQATLRRLMHSLMEMPR